MLNEHDKRLKRKYIQKYLEGKLEFLQIPSWVLANHRCQRVTSSGQCNEPMYQRPDGSVPRWCYPCRLKSTKEQLAANKTISERMVDTYMKGAALPK